MARELLVGGTDRIAVTRLPSINLASQAYRGEAGDGSFLVDDEAAALTFPSLKVVEMTDDASGGTKYLYRGRVMSKALDGDPYVTGNSRMYAISTSDSNWDLRRLRVHNWVRPSETGRARVVALGAYILNGSSSTVTNARKRASTVINVTTYAPNTNTATMPAHTYDSTDPFAVIDDCARAEGKDFFVYQDEDGDLFLWFDQRTSSSLSSTLSITDVDPDLSTEFPPAHDGQPGMQDGTELLSGGALIDSTGAVVTEYRSGIETAYDVAEDTISDSGASGDASTRLSGFLDERDNEELRYACYVLLPAEKAHLIRAGMVISFRWADAGVTSPTDVRVARCGVELIEDELYKLHLELSYPEKIGPRIKDYGKGTIAANSGGGFIENTCIDTFSRIEVLTGGTWGISEINSLPWNFEQISGVNGDQYLYVDGAQGIYQHDAGVAIAEYLDPTITPPSEVLIRYSVHMMGYYAITSQIGFGWTGAPTPNTATDYAYFTLDWDETLGGSFDLPKSYDVVLDSGFSISTTDPGNGTILTTFPVSDGEQDVDYGATIRLRLQDDAVKFRWWRNGYDEPVTWFSADADFTGLTMQSVVIFLTSAGDGVQGVTWRIDSVEFTEGLDC